MSTLRPLLSSLVAVAPLIGQCDLNWSPGVPASGPNGSIAALVSLPNGDLVAAGAFSTADAEVTNRIARWDGSTWRAMGSGAGGNVTCLARLPNGDVVAGGTFTVMGGVACNRIARWNGTAWSPLGTGFDGGLTALLTLANGDLVAAGNFQTAGGLTANGIARWNGSAWSAFGQGLPQGSPFALAQHQNGTVYVGGEFLAGNDGLLAWNGTQWVPAPGLPPSSTPSVRDFVFLPNGGIALSGTLVVNFAYQSLALWDGTAMQALPASVNSGERALLATSSGVLLLGGTAPATQPSLLFWTGTGWTPLAGAPNNIVTMIEDGTGRIVVGTQATTVQPHPSPVARFDGVQWTRLGAPVPAVPRAMLTLPGGDVVVGGNFTSFRGVAANHLARWNGTTWAPLGLGVDGPVRTMALAPNGDLIVSGTFQNAGGAPANRIARWNGSVWSTLGAGLPVEAQSLAVVPTGEVYATGTSGGLREFRNGLWTTVVVPGAIVAPLSLAVLANGSLALGGIYSGSPIGGLAVMTSTGISVVPGSPTAIQRMFVGRDGTLYAMTGVGARSWDGTTWTSLGYSGIQAFAQLPDGDLLVGGNIVSLPGSPVASALSRLTPNGWVSVGAVQVGSVTSLAVSGRGELLVGGSFMTVEGAVATNFAQAMPTCPASVQTVGTGCSGGAGPVTLTARTLPWAGDTLRADAIGMTTNSVALQLLGVQGASGPLPGGAPGCSLWVTPLLADTLLPQGGAAEAAFAVPDSPSLAGLTFRLQVVGIELGPTGIVRLTSTNALEATIGAL